MLISGRMRRSQVPFWKSTQKTNFCSSTINDLDGKAATRSKKSGQPSKKGTQQQTITNWKGDNERAFFISLANELGLKEKEDWYQITKENVVNFGGEEMLMRYYDGMVVTALHKLYPDHIWLPWKFRDAVPLKTWNNVQLQTLFMQHLAKDLKITHMEDWYAVGAPHIRQRGGAGLLSKYGNSPSKLITSVFTEHHWNLHKFNLKPNGAWNDIHFQKQFINYLGRELKITKMEDWYHVGVVQIREKGGSSLLQMYHNSPFKMISSLFPDHQWNPVLFSNSPRNMWNRIEFQRAFLDRLATKLNIQTMEDWYTVTRTLLYQQGAGKLLQRFHNSTFKMMSCVFPEHSWDQHSFGRSKRNKHHSTSQKDALMIHSIH
eukprot:TRINITY_DN1134_c0_g1_i1.p1 TRINITY_DN1134_c0_g1~~TRINITY_DN1134_c0_g1_i1.p1  ORF type:complete len:375 (+),score=67.80 TRINITY_DN1134_c0_g1_i1:56-1180(+)